MKLENSLVKILIVDDELQYREVLEMILGDQGYTTDTAASAEEAISKIKENEYHIVLTDLMMGKMDGIDLLTEIKEYQKDIEVILITGHGTINNAVEAMKLGAYTYFIKGHKSEELIKEVKKIESKVLLKIGNRMLNEGSNDSNFMLTTKNSKFKKILETTKKAARSNVNILILGESGVGKEVFARHIHNTSSRNEKPFIPVNCTSFSDNLLESELFGHEKGSFTGATTKRHGRFENSHEGTLFLDEIGDISLSTQVKLLRTLETKNVQRIGSSESINVDFRLITATNKNLEKEIIAGGFREDFFYRISTITIEIPPLRERKEDLEMLIDFFLMKSEKTMNKEINEIESGVMDFLLSYDYPGNVRELKNIMDRLVVLSEDGKILERDLPKCREASANEKGDINFELDEDVIKVKQSKLIKPLKDVRKEIEAEYIEKVLLICDNNISEAARKLSISRRQLFNKVVEYGLKSE